MINHLDININDFVRQQQNDFMITKSLCSLLKNSENIIIYGAGFQGIETIIQLKRYGLKPHFIVDENKELTGKSIGGIPIMSLEILSTIGKDSVIIITPRYASVEIEITLRSLGFSNIIIDDNFVEEHFILKGYKQNCKQKQEIYLQNKSKIDFVRNNLADSHSVKVFDAVIKLWCYGDCNDLIKIAKNESYYPTDIIALKNDEVFVDCGAYIGDSVEEFAVKTAEKYKAIYAYEASELQYEQAKAYLRRKKIERIELSNVGVWSCENILSFSSEGKAGDRIFDGGEIKIKVDSLDNLLKNKLPPTYIKMDIEGAELEALKGSTEIIKTYSPKLGVCVYHKFGDIWEIPNFILETFNNYKIYLRADDPLLEFKCFAIKE
jgi:FkbM family methyltransferase